MQRIKMVLQAAAIAGVVATLLSGMVFAAQVTRVNDRKGHVVINEGKDAGYQLGAIVCFYASTGEIIGCGKVYQVSAENATVFINKREAIHIKNGMEAVLKGEPAKTKQSDKK